ncbi:cutinase family protein [Corynebacterium stationis]|uniref:cutinase family protein n=1 Tax=Corynebacterium stationis TaxID=1705 RepID=UPI00263AEF0A|nr:cutinase family protein [Corynebacterium stationis]
MLLAGLTPAAGHAKVQEQICPVTVMLAARGSDQNEEYGEYFGPQLYSENSAPSNGYEGPNFTAMFHQLEQRHPGTMDSVYVLALDDEAYPAAMGLPPLAEEGENIGLIELVQRAVGIVQQYPIHDLIHSVAFGFIDSVRSGMSNAPKVVEEYEATTGCKPNYVVAGFSQGALVTTSVEKYLANTGRLEGAVTIGNPLHKYPWAMERAALPEGRRVDYCLNGDFVCDFSLEAASDALSTKAEVHASYFLNEPTAQDVRVIDAVAGLLNSAD